MIDSISVKVTFDDLDFDSLLLKGWRYPNNPSGAYKDTLVKELEGTECYLVKRFGKVVANIFCYEPLETVRVFGALCKELGE